MLEAPSERVFRTCALRSHTGVFTNFYLHPVALSLCARIGSEMWVVELSISPDGPYFGWWMPETGRIGVIQPNRVLFDVALNYAVEELERTDQGRTVRMDVRGIRKLTEVERNLGPGEPFDLEKVKV